MVYASLLGKSLFVVFGKSFLGFCKIFTPGGPYYKKAPHNMNQLFDYKQIFSVKDVVSKFKLSMAIKQQNELKVEWEDKPKLRTSITFKDYPQFSAYVGKPLSFVGQVNSFPSTDGIFQRFFNSFCCFMIILILKQHPLLKISIDKQIIGSYSQRRSKYIVWIFHILTPILSTWGLL